MKTFRGKTDSQSDFFPITFSLQFIAQSSFPETKEYSHQNCCLFGNSVKGSTSYLSTVVGFLLLKCEWVKSENCSL